MSPREPAAIRIARTAQERYAPDAAPTGSRGDIGLADGPTSRTVAARMNADREPGAASVQSGDVAALSLLHEIAHLLVERFEATAQPKARQRAAEGLHARLGRDGDRILDRFARTFPTRLAEPEDAASIVGELILTRLANENPAIGPLRQLVDDRLLARSAAYGRAVTELEALLVAAGPVPGAGDGGRAAEQPPRASPRPGPPRPDLARRPAPLHPRELAGAPRRRPGRPPRPARYRPRRACRGGTRAASPVRRRRSGTGCPARRPRARGARRGGGTVQHAIPSGCRGWS